MESNPQHQPWKAEGFAIELHPCITIMGRLKGIEPRMSEPQSDVLTTSPQPP